MNITTIYFSATWLSLEVIGQWIIYIELHKFSTQLNAKYKVYLLLYL